jgi:hypothetical protein
MEMNARGVVPMPLIKLFRFFSAAILAVLWVVIAILTVIIIHGLFRSPYGAAGVSALLAHLDSSNILNPTEQIINISRFFLTYIGGLYLALLLWLGRSWLIRRLKC